MKNANIAITRITDKKGRRDILRSHKSKIFIEKHEANSPEVNLKEEDNYIDSPIIERSGKKPINREDRKNIAVVPVHHSNSDDEVISLNDK